LSLRLATRPHHASTRKTIITTRTLSCAVVLIYRMALARRGQSNTGPHNAHTMFPPSAGRNGSHTHHVPESNLPQKHNKTCIFTRMYPKCSLLGFRTSWLSAVSTVVIRLRILTKELNTPNYHYSTELNRVDSVKMASYLCHTITNNLYITCE